MIGKFFDAIKKTVSVITAADQDDEPIEQDGQGTQNYGTYELSDIFPYKIYVGQKGDTIKLICSKLSMPEAKLRNLNDIPADADPSLPLDGKKLVVQDQIPNVEEGIHDLTVGDLLHFDFETIAEREEQPISTCTTRQSGETRSASSSSPTSRFCSSL